MHAGMAAIEFALIVPIMGVMFIGAVELSQAITVDRRVTQIASSTADLVARAETSRSRRPTIADIMRAGSYIMAPYTPEPAADRRAQRPVVADQRDQRQAVWRAPTMAPAARSTCACTKHRFTLPGQPRDHQRQPWWSRRSPTPTSRWCSTTS